MSFLLTAIRLPHTQLWATVKGASLTNLMLNTKLDTYSSRGSQGASKGLVPKPSLAASGFEPGSLQFLMYRLILQGHSPKINEKL